MLIIITITSFVSIMFFFIKTPLAKASTIIIQTINVALIRYVFTSISWYIYVVVIIFIRGIMVLFSYIRAIARNIIITSSINGLTKVKLTRIISLIIVVITSACAPQIVWSQLLILNTNNFIIINVNKLFISFNRCLTILIIIYLLIRLIVVVKITFYNKGPIKAISHFFFFFFVRNNSIQ